MLKQGGIATSDVIRSMKRMGFSHEEIYDVLTGIGLPGEQVQLLIDRIQEEFEEAKLEPHTTRLGLEVREVFEEKLGEVQHTMSVRMDSLSSELQLMKNEVEKLGMRIVDLQTIVTKAQVEIDGLRSEVKRLIKQSTKVGRRRD